MFNAALRYDITIPVLNEEKRLAINIPFLYKFLEEMQLQQFTITIANNGSTDRTEEVCRQLIEDYPKLSYLQVDKKGVGLALKKSWAQSNADVIGYMDVDMATDILHFREVVAKFESGFQHIVIGSRYLAESSVQNRKLLRTITSIGFNKILKYALATRFSDAMCGFKFLQRDCYNQLQKMGLQNDGLFFCTELLFLAEKMNLPIHEIPVKWTDDQDSRIDVMHTSFYYLSEIFKLRFRNFDTVSS